MHVHGSRSDSDRVMPYLSEVSSRWRKEARRDVCEEEEKGQSLAPTVTGPEAITHEENPVRLDEPL